MIKTPHWSLLPESYKDVRKVIESLVAGKVNPEELQTGDIAELLLVKGIAYLLQGNIEHAFNCLHPDREYNLDLTGAIKLGKLIQQINTKLSEVQNPSPEQMAFIQNFLQEVEQKAQDSIKKMKFKYAMMALGLEL